ncbi:hypothetical protein [Legionella saoudiensis]|uniref:hypothetical protein n=1 Tax=Legionella saoudiensis TaxID=1750561 RepID=UPI0007305A4D|nr:hypothetical protein [Legionella saoudiensis]
MLISPEKDENKIQFRVRIKASVFKEIEDYCEWAGIQYKDYFIQQACQYIFSNDESWINYKNQKVKDS